MSDRCQRMVNGARCGSRWHYDYECFSGGYTRVTMALADAVFGPLLGWMR